MARPTHQPLDAIERCAPYVRLVHDFVTQRDYVQAQRTINDHALLFFHSGEGSCTAGNDALAIRPGRLLLIPPGAPHRFAALPGTRFHMFNIHFDPAMREDSRRFVLYFDQRTRRPLDAASLDVFPGGQPRRIQALDLGDAEGYAKVFHAVRAHFPAQDRTGLLRVRAAMLELLAWLHAAAAGAGAPDDALSDALVRARDLIRERYHEPLRLDGIAARVNLGRTVLAVGFRRRFGIPPMAYLRGIRIEHAKVLLAAEGLATKAVAARVGFAGIHHFTRTFTRVVGIPPAAYRRGPSAQA